MTPTIPNIPPELFTQILQLACSSTIASCSLVNRKWHNFAHPLLYKDLVLAGSDQVERFLAAHNDSLVRSFTRSLTLYLREDDEPSSDLQTRVNDTLCRLAKEVIPHMSSLVSFSLTVDRRTFRLGILKTTISTLLNALPYSCNNLELDTDTREKTPFDEDGPLYEGDVHLCDHLRWLFHRIRNARIDLQCVCENMFGRQLTNEEYSYIDLPFIQHLLIETTGASIRGPCISRRRETSSWPQMIRVLEHVAKKKGTAPGKLSVLGKAFRGSPTERFYQTLLRCEMRGGEEGTTTLAFPAEPFHRIHPGSGGLYARTDEGPFVMQSVESFYDIAGGRPWRTAASGARLPVSLFPDMTWTSDNDAGIFTEEEWKKKFSDGPFCLWGDERKVGGAWLMNVEERKNDIELRKVREKLPDGLIRVRHAIRPIDPSQPPPYYIDSDDDEL